MGSSTDRYETTVTISSPARATFGYVGWNGALGTPAGVDPSGLESYAYPSLPRFAGAQVPIVVTGVQQSDNLYTLRTEAARMLAPLAPDRFDDPLRHPLQLSDNDSRATAAPIGLPGATAANDGWDMSTAGVASITLKQLNFHKSLDVDWVTLNHLDFNGQAPCGGALVVTAPDDISISISTNRPGIHSDGLRLAVLNIPPPGGAKAPTEFYIRMRSESDAALEYDATISLVSFSNVVCGLKDRWHRDDMIVARYPPSPLRVDLTSRVVAGALSRPMVFLLDHAEPGPIRVSGRLLRGRSLGVRVLDPNGRLLWQRTTGDRDLEETRRGGNTFSAMIEKARLGTYVVVIESRDRQAVLEIR